MIQCNHHAARVHTLWQRKKRGKERKFNSKITASSSRLLFTRVPGIFFKNQPTKNTKKQVKRTGEATTVVPGIRITSRTLWTTTNKLKAGQAAKGRDNEGRMRRSHTCVLLRSCRDVRRPRHPAAQRKNCRYFSTSSRWDYEKTNLVFRRSPDRGGILTENRKQT